MKAEIIAVGSELLLGQIANTNAKFISSSLADIGIDVHYHTVVGDNTSRLESVIKLAEERANLLIFTGGLGPTKDDMTKETIASHLQSSLVSDDNALVQIQDYFLRSGREMTENNKKQALVLDGAIVLPNRNGMAPGMAVKKNNRHYILLPGPPHEMQPMFQQFAIPYLLEAMGENEVITSRVLKFFGIGEAELEFRLQTILEAQSNPTIAPLATADAVTLRITAKAHSLEEANALIFPVEEQIRKIVGEFIFGIDEETLASKAAELLLGNGLTIAAAESLTAGLFMAELGGEPGISDALVGGAVVYQAESKTNQLGISEELIQRFGIVSAECASALAVSVQRKFNSDIGIGLTGAAGPDTHGGQPAGTVWIGISYKEETPKTFKLLLSGNRNTNRLRAARFALYYLLQVLKEITPKV